MATWLRCPPRKKNMLGSIPQTFELQYHFVLHICSDRYKPGQCTPPKNNRLTAVAVIESAGTRAKVNIVNGSLNEREERFLLFIFLSTASLGQARRLTRAFPARSR